ncbi:Myozenin-2 [Merluccius polli]|uniref:Myozenin-2 n=1 Tax=Merluccius polli TaxID=89951 RepID=A0AA47M7I2_MERPO|nr:Myozenin-2 [Merluccius polli]
MCVCVHTCVCVCVCVLRNSLTNALFSQLFPGDLSVAKTVRAGGGPGMSQGQARGGPWAGLTRARAPLYPCRPAGTQATMSTPVPPNKRKKANKIITDLSNISQNDDESDPEASEFDLGTKIKTPKDVMLEELSLMKNKGSKMFRMRQQRVEKFIVTDENMVHNLENLLMSPPTPPPKPDMLKPEVVEETVHEEEKETMRIEYVSPWERAMKGNEELTATMRASMPGPIQIHPDLPSFKSFNRTALPFGGYDKASRLLTFELPDVNTMAAEEADPLPTLQADIRSRPSFNRTPIGWVCNEDNSNIHLDVDNMPFDGETDDLCESDSAARDNHRGCVSPLTPFPISIFFFCFISIIIIIIIIIIMIIGISIIIISFIIIIIHDLQADRSSVFSAADSRSGFIVPTGLYRSDGLRFRLGFDRSVCSPPQRGQITRSVKDTTKKNPHIPTQQRLGKKCVPTPCPVCLFYSMSHVAVTVTLECLIMYHI